MVKIERRLRRKILEDLGPRPPAPPPSSRGAPYGANEVTAENLLAVTEELRDRQDKIPGATAALYVAEEELRARASSGKSLQQQEPPGTRAPGSRGIQGPGARVSRGESLRQRGTPGLKASNDRESIMHVVGLCGTNRTLATWAREALVIPTKKNYKGEQLHWEEERIKHTNRKFRDPRVESKGMGESQLKEGPIERRRGMIRGEESIRQLEVSEASSAASSRKKEGTAIVSREIDRAAAS